MKHILRVFVFYTLAIWIASQVLPTFTIRGSWSVLVLAGVSLGLLMLIVKPLLTILLIPVTILTFGLLSWLSNVVVLYLLTVIVPEVAIREWTFPGVSWSGFIVPSFHVNWFFALIVTSFVITGITNTLEATSER